jgi:hypothetical protein
MEADGGLREPAFKHKQINESTDFLAQVAVGG